MKGRAGWVKLGLVVMVGVEVGAGQGLRFFQQFVLGLKLGIH